MPDSPKENVMCNAYFIHYISCMHGLYSIQYKMNYKILYRMDKIGQFFFSSLPTLLLLLLFLYIYRYFIPENF